jgi:serine/threonine protein phosphatase PrpC
MQITSFTISEPGSRDYNEDAYGDAELMAGRCLIVADGAGGHRGGAIASKVVVDAALLHLAAASTWGNAALTDAIDAASLAVRRRQGEETWLARMSSTVALLCIDAAKASARWAHLGDSRVLFFRRGNVQQLTRDHSVIQSLTDAGLLNGESTMRGMDRTTLYAAVGAEGDTRPVAGEGMELADGDAFILCSDGVWDTVGAEHMASLLGFAGTVREWVELIGSAVRKVAKSNQDNYTAIGVWIGSPEQITVTRV